MQKLSSVQAKADFSLFISNAVSALGAKHHGGATHKIVHNIIFFWHQRFFVYFVEFYGVVIGDLQLVVASYIINQPALLNIIILLPPKHQLFVFSDFLFLEKENFHRRLHKDDFIINIMDVHKKRPLRAFYLYLIKFCLYIHTNVDVSQSFTLFYTPVQCLTYWY